MVLDKNIPANRYANSSEAPHNFNIAKVTSPTITPQTNINIAFIFLYS